MNKYKFSPKGILLFLLPHQERNEIYVLNSGLIAQQRERNKTSVWHTRRNQELGKHACFFFLNLLHFFLAIYEQKEKVIFYDIRQPIFTSGVMINTNIWMEWCEKRHFRGVDFGVTAQKNAGNIC